MFVILGNRNDASKAAFECLLTVAIAGPPDGSYRVSRRSSPCSGQEGKRISRH
ncbi:MAG: hypothetical protein JWQ59_2131 [Cryobacterium sp.]|nr:hypothetical protein [Cryobacterium sp.]